VRARVVNQNVANQFAGESEELSTILPAEFLLRAEPQIRFMDDGRGLKAVAMSLADQMPTRKPAQLVINKRHQFIKRRPVTVTPP
jgi:hypothetical protein